MKTTEAEASTSSGESPIPLVKGTRDRLPREFARFAKLERVLLDRFALSGYRPLRTPVLEYSDLHERKSGAAIVTKLFELSEAGLDPVCLRPELTAGIVRAYVEAEPPPALPWRVSHSGPVFRFENAGVEDAGADRLREFHQVGVELLGGAGPMIDGEVIRLADEALADLGISDARVRVGNVGLILEILNRSGLPPSARAALVEMLGEAAAEGDNVRSLDDGLDRLASLLNASQTDEIPLAIDQADDRAIDRLFRTLVPEITGRRQGREIIHRLRRKWDLGHDLRGVLDRLRLRVRELDGLKGPARDVVARLERDYVKDAPESVIEIRDLVRVLGDYGVDPDRLELDLGFGRGIGFYSQMIFELIVETPGGPVEVCGGGRYDGLARVLGGKRDDRGVGFAFGLERLARVLEARGVSIEGSASNRGALIAPETPELAAEALKLALLLRRQGIIAVLGEPGASPRRAEAAGTFALAIVRDRLDRPDCLVVSDLVNSRSRSADPSSLIASARNEGWGERS